MSNATDSTSRRGLFRGLAALPLIGGPVSVLGNPTKAAEPVTADLIEAYDTWLFYERRGLRFERYGALDPDHSWDRRVALVEPETGLMWNQVSVLNAGGRYHRYTPDEPTASSRAAVVLSAVGCDWRAA